MNRAERLAAWDGRLVEIASSIKILSALSWPDPVVARAIADVEAGRRRLPDPPPPERRFDDTLEALEALRAGIDRGDPVGAYLAATAESYAGACRLLHAAGTPEMYQHSLALYGSTRQPLPGSEDPPLVTARALLDATDVVRAAGLVEEPATLDADVVQRRLQDAFAPFFVDDEVEVVVDPSLASKAAAGATRVRLRGATTFSELDVAQLVQHEGFVHSATALNGRRQPTIASLSLGAPRTTMTQEGIATFAELATRAIDVSRLRRIAVRIEAVAAAEDGADFLDVVDVFAAAGQSTAESVRSAMRVFRGAPIRGGAPFTKDIVYLNGLLAVHTFLLESVHGARPVRIGRLFAGRLTLGDVLTLEEAFEDGTLDPGHYVPEWARSTSTLAAYLAFSAVASTFDLQRVTLDDFA